MISFKYGIILVIILCIYFSYKGTKEGLTDYSWLKVGLDYGGSLAQIAAPGNNDGGTTIYACKNPRGLTGPIWTGPVTNAQTEAVAWSWDYECNTCGSGGWRLPAVGGDVYRLTRQPCSTTTRRRGHQYGSTTVLASSSQLFLF